MIHSATCLLVRLWNVDWRRYFERARHRAVETLTGFQEWFRLPLETAETTGRLFARKKGVNRLPEIVRLALPWPAPRKNSRSDRNGPQAAQIACFFAAFEAAERPGRR